MIPSKTVHANKNTGSTDPMKPNPKIVIVIPAYNEAYHIGDTVTRIHRVASSVIVVDDGSSDETAQLARAAGAFVVHNTQHQGKGVALTYGFALARTQNPDVVVTLSGAHAVPVQMFEVILPILTCQVDIVVGSRTIQETFPFGVLRRWFNTFIGFAAGVTVTDSLSNFRAFSAHALEVLSFQSPLFPELELQFIARDHNLRTAEVPITFASG